VDKSPWTSREFYRL